jgi:hypothetical protein
MKRETSDNASRRHIFVVILEITILVFLVLISTADAMQFATAAASSGNLQKIRTFDPALKNFYEKEIKTRTKHFKLIRLTRMIGTVKETILLPYIGMMKR